MVKQTIISPEQAVFTLVNVFTVEVDKQQKLVDTLTETTATITRHIPGFVSSSIHKSMDGKRVVNYGQWNNKAAFETMMQNVEMQVAIAKAVQLAQPDGHFYTITTTFTTQGESGEITHPLAMYRLFQQYLFTGAVDRMHEVVDLERYSENCVGFTPGWITGFNVAFDQYTANVASAMSNVKVTEENVVEGVDSVVIRSRIEATHVGLLLGIPATGKRFTYESTDMLRVHHGRIVWRWLLSDLYAIEHQLKASITQQNTGDIK